MSAGVIRVPVRLCENNLFPDSLRERTAITAKKEKLSLFIDKLIY